MPAITKILFPVDFSERCAAAVPWVQAFACLFDAELVLLHVVEPAPFLLGNLEIGATPTDCFHAELLAESRSRLRGYLSEDLNGRAVRRTLVEGDPAIRIVDFAQHEAVDLIMMPSHGFGPFRRFILGSVTAKVLHDAHPPVWTGTHIEDLRRPEAGIRLRQVLCAVDLGPQSLAALKWAAQLALRCQAHLMVVHAVPGIESRPARYFDAELSQMLRREAREQLSDLLAKAQVEAEVCLGAGEAAEVVRYAAERHDADLVVIGRGTAAVSGGRLRTHAYSIIRQSPCPVVSV